MTSVIVCSWLSFQQRMTSVSEALISNAMLYNAKEPHYNLSPGLYNLIFTLADMCIQGCILDGPSVSLLVGKVCVMPCYSVCPVVETVLLRSPVCVRQQQITDLTKPVLICFCTIVFQLQVPYSKVFNFLNFNPLTFLRQ